MSETLWFMRDPPPGRVMIHPPTGRRTRLKALPKFEYAKS